MFSFVIDKRSSTGLNRIQQYDSLNFDVPRQNFKRASVDIVDLHNVVLDLLYCSMTFKNVFISYFGGFMSQC